MRKGRNKGSTVIARRRFMQLSAFGLAAAWSGEKAAGAGTGGQLGSAPRTAILEGGVTDAVLTTGPLASMGAAPGARVGLCLLVGGADHRGGRLPLLLGVERAELSTGGVSSFEADRGVERAVYRLLDGLDTVRPVELFGLSAKVDENGLEVGTALQITWQTALRPDVGQGVSLRGYLDAFHAVVIGQLAANSTFASLSYVEISRNRQT